MYCVRMYGTKLRSRVLNENGPATPSQNCITLLIRWCNQHICDGNCQLSPRTCLATHRTKWNKHSNGAFAIRLFTFRRKIENTRAIESTNSCKDDTAPTYFLQKYPQITSVSARIDCVGQSVAWKWSEMFQILFSFVCRVGKGTPHHQLQQCHRFTQTSRMRSPFEPKKSLGFVEQKLGENERLRLPLSSLAKPLLFTAGVSQFS